MLLGAMLCSCNGTSRQKVLRFLFDEPPVDRSPDTTAQVTKAKKIEGPPPPVPVYVLHPPYAEKECGSCHALRSSKTFREAALATSLDEGKARHRSRLITDKEELCYECHDDKSPESLSQGGAYVHGPTAAGECTACHDPHKSRFPSLLRKGDPVAELCFTCHDQEDVKAVDVHEDVIAEGLCTECHDPHASGEEFLLK